MAFLPMDSLKNHRVVEHVSPGVRSELLDVLIGTERPQDFIAMRTNSSLSQLWSVTRGGGSAHCRRLSAKSQVLRLPYLC